MTRTTNDQDRIVITGVGLTAPNGNNLAEYRDALLNGRSGISHYNIRYVGDTLAGVCDFDELRYQKRKEVRRGTRAGSIGIYCAQEAVTDAGLDWANIDKSRVGIYVGVTEHGTVETENEIYEIKQFDYDTKVWSHHHNPRTVANNPAGEISLNMGITGPHYTIGAACAAGNAGLIQGAQMLLLGECDVALAGGVSESIRSFGIFAGFASQGALATHEDPTKASRPFDVARNGIVVAEGGCIYTLERLSDARRRGANLYGELVGWAITSDAADFVLPDHKGQIRCMRLAIDRSGVNPADIDLVSTHATATESGDIQECLAINDVFVGSANTWVNNTKSFIGHAMGAAGALELAGNLTSFKDRVCHATINCDDLDPQCAVPGLILGEPRKKDSVEYILNNSFGMLGINSTLIVRRV
jgi:3-oxoacyl-[acyl-carrier-protein] synthase II